MTLKRQKSLRKAISSEKANLASLEQKRLESQERLAALKAELTSIQSPIAVSTGPAKQPSADKSLTPKEKISLFRQLFRGRNDVYPLLWISSKTGRKGYSPACGNEWVRGVCENPG